MRTQILFLSLGRVFGSIIQALIIIVVARKVSVIDFGQLSTILSIGVVAAAAADLGISSLLAKARAQRDSSLVDGCLRLNRIATTAAFLMFAAALYIWDSGDRASFVVLAFALMLEKNVDCGLSIPVADQDKFTPALSVVLRRTATLLCFLVLVLPDSARPIPAYCFSYAIGSTVAQIHLLIVLRISLAKDQEKVEEKLLKTTLRSTLPYFLSNFSAQVRMVDTAIVGWLGSPIAAGLYSGANRLVAPFGLIPGVVTTVLLPHATKFSPVQARKTSRRFIAYTIAFTIALVPFAIFSTSIIAFVLGDKFSGAGGALAMALLGFPAICLASPLGSILQAKGYENFVGANGVFFSVLALAAVGVGASLGGATVAAAGLSLAFVSKCVVLFLYSERHISEATEREVSVK